MDYQKELSEHNRRMRTDILYRLQEQLEDMRVDMIPGRGTDREETIEPVVKPKSIYFKMDRGAFELNRRVKELENSNQYLIRKIKEITGNASKRETYTIK